MTTPTQAQIAEAAHRLWEEEGRPDGRDEDHWHRARTALETVPMQDAVAPPPKAKAPRARKPAAPKTSSPSEV